MCFFLWFLHPYWRKYMWKPSQTSKPVESRTRCIVKAALVCHINFTALQCESLESGYCTRMEDCALLHLNLKSQGAFMWWSSTRVLLGRCFIIINLVTKVLMLAVLPVLKYRRIQRQGSALEMATIFFLPFTAS